MVEEANQVAVKWFKHMERVSRERLPKRLCVLEVEEARREETDKVEGDVKEALGYCGLNILVDKL